MSSIRKGLYSFLFFSKLVFSYQNELVPKFLLKRDCARDKCVPDSYCIDLLCDQCVDGICMELTLGVIVGSMDSSTSLDLSLLDDAFQKKTKDFEANREPLKRKAESGYKENEEETQDTNDNYEPRSKKLRIDDGVIKEKQVEMNNSDQNYEPPNKMSNELIENESAIPYIR